MLKKGDPLYYMINGFTTVRDEMSFQQLQEYLLNLCRICAKQGEIDTQIRKKGRQRFCKNVQDNIFIFLWFGYFM